MRISDHFGDYYDRAMSNGSDASRFYLRETSVRDETSDDGWVLPLRTFFSAGAINGTHDTGSGTVSLRGFVVLFCARAYIGLRVRTYVNGNPADPEGVTFVQGQGDSEERFFYDVASAGSYLEAHFASEQLLKKKVKWADRDNPIANGTLLERVQRLFEIPPSEQLTAWAVQQRIAAAVLLPRVARGSHQLVVNPALKDFQFYKVYGPVEAYQELDMFWGGVLAPESSPMIEVPDKYKIAGHGFDQHSFRKAPTKQR
jgi:hypothetical protein